MAEIQPMTAPTEAEILEDMEREIEAAVIRARRRLEALRQRSRPSSGARKARTA